MNITIPAEATPTGLITCEFRRPKYIDRREASRKYPGTQANPGYTLEQLFFSYCLVRVNDYIYPPNPADYIARLDNFPLEDSQFCLDVFLELYTLNRELNASAVDYGLKLKKNIAASYIIPASEMPGGGPAVEIKAPLLQDSVKANRMISREESAYTSEELLLANSIVSIDGKPVERKGDPIEVLDGLWHEDVQYLLGVFFSMFTLDRPKREAARSWAKRLKEGNESSTTEKTPVVGVTKTSATSK